ncbi:MAG: hypothetical protein ACREJE_01610 [Candidatus Rokuibacteriota bacterium]
MEAWTTIAGQLVEVHGDYFVLGDRDGTHTRILLPPDLPAMQWQVGTYLRVMVNHQDGDLVAERIESALPLEDPSDLLAELGPQADLAPLVNRAVQNDLPWVVVSSAAVAAWEQRDPAAWARVSQWLAAKRVAVVQI